MANGLFGKGLSQANTWINYYTVPTSVALAKATIAICNPSPTDDAIYEVAVTSNATPSPEDILEPPTKLIPGQVFERSCNYLSPGEKIYVRVNVDNIPVRVSGVEVSGS